MLSVLDTRLDQTLIVIPTVSLGHNSYVQSLPGLDKDLHCLSIYAHFHSSQDRQALPYHGWCPHHLWLLDRPRIRLHVHPCGFLLEPKYLGTLHEQACLLVL